MPSAEPSVFARKLPSQARAKQTVETILEATAQILLRDGDEKLTTNHIARKAGFSIGTIYQYFPNKEAIKLALIERERELLERQVREALSERKEEPFEDTVRRVVRVLIETFGAYRRVRNSFTFITMRMAMASNVPTQLDVISKFVVAEWNAAHPAGAGGLDENEAYVLTRAVRGVLRQAVVEDWPTIGEPPFEEALVRLIMGFLAAPSAPLR